MIQCPKYVPSLPGWGSGGRRLSRFRHRAAAQVLCARRWCGERAVEAASHPQKLHRPEKIQPDDRPLIVRVPDSTSDVSL